MPFEQLLSDEARWRLSVCRPKGAFTQSNFSDIGVPTYCHITGGVDFRRRSALQLTSLLGFVLSRNDGAFLHNNLSENEVAAIHECISWGRQRGNNPVRHVWSYPLRQALPLSFSPFGCLGVSGS